MKQETQQEHLSRLGEELLQEFDTAQHQPVSAEFDWKCRNMVRRKSRIGGTVLWMARAAVFAFFLVGVMTVAMLSFGSLRTPLIRFAVEHFEPAEEDRETELAYRQISHTAVNNTELTVYYDGGEQYLVLLSNELGQRQYSFLSSNLEEEIIQEIDAKLAAENG